MDVGNVTGDVTGADVSEAGNVVVGKENRQQTVTVNALPLHDDSEHITTIALVYELVTKLMKQIDQERKERTEDMAALRSELDRLRTTAAAMQLQIERVGDHLATVAAHWPKAVVVSDRHRWTFATAFAMLFAPVPLFYSQVRDHLDIGWQAALLLAAIAYLVSALLWSYMWWGK